MIPKKLHILLLLLLVPALTALAQDEVPAPGEADIQVGLAKQRLIIAVAAPLPEAGADAAIGEDVAQILRRDLGIAGEFELIGADTFLPGLAEEGLAVAESDFDGWYNTGAEAVIKGRYRVEGDTLRLDLRLYDVASGREIPLSYKRPGATSTAYRGEVHAFANAVLEYFTGAEGIFGQQILAVRRTRSGSRVVRLGVDGAGATTVSSGSDLNILPAWGPGGSVLYTAFSGESWPLKRDGETIASFSGLNSGADFCPGSGRIALTLTKDGSPEIYTMNPDGTALKRLTENGYIDISPSWSPDCKRIAFVSNRGGSTQIYVMDADGQNTRLLTTQGTYNTSPAWSPQGDKIAFTARDEYHVFDIFTVDADSGYIQRLTQDQGHNEEPSWSPDGRYLVFSSTRAGGSKLFISTADGRVQTVITESGRYETPAWSY